MPAQPGRDVGSPWVSHGRGLGLFGALAVEAFILFQEKKELNRVALGHLNDQNNFIVLFQTLFGKGGDRSNPERFFFFLAMTI